MSVQTISIGRSILPSRATSLLLPPAAKPRNLRRAEFALIDALQALTRAGQGVLLLAAVDQPAPAIAYDMPFVRATAPLIPTPYGVLTQLLSAIASMPDTRAAVRASAHTLGLSLTRPEQGATAGGWPAAQVTQLITRMLTDEGLVIHLDDLHRADAPSLTVLAGVAAGLGSQPVSLVCAYRADQTQPAELTALMNTPSARTVALAFSWADDNTVLLDSLLGRKAPLGMMLEAAKADERTLLLGGVPLLEACRRSGRWTDGLMLSERIIGQAQLLGAEYVAAAARAIRSQILLGLGQWAEVQAECDQVITSRACARDVNLTATAMWGGYKARSTAGLPARNLMDALKRWRTTVRHTDDPAAAAVVMADLIVHLTETDQLNEARAWLREVEALVERTGHPQARLAQAVGQGALAGATNDWRTAVGAYRAAGQHAAQLRDLLLEARANGGLALALLQIGDGESKNEGRERLSMAHSVLSRLNARPDMERCEAGAKQFGLRPRQRRPSAANRTPGALTRREREVLALVVNGLTNRQIAQRLTISEKTAEGHVGNILAKLSVSSRGKAAELAKATGLLEGTAA